MDWSVILTSSALASLLTTAWTSHLGAAIELVKKRNAFLTKKIDLLLEARRTYWENYWKTSQELDAAQGANPHLKRVFQDEVFAVNRMMIQITCLDFLLSDVEKGGGCIGFLGLKDMQNEMLDFADRFYNMKKTPELPDISEHIGIPSVEVRQMERAISKISQYRTDFRKEADSVLAFALQDTRKELEAAPKKVIGMIPLQ